MSALVVQVGRQTMWAGYGHRSYHGPTAVAATPDGLRYGDTAVEYGAQDPEVFEPDPLFYVGEAFLVIGAHAASMGSVLAGMLAHAVAHVVGPGYADLLVLTHPSSWGQSRCQALHAAAQTLAPHVVLMPHAEAVVWGMAERGQGGGPTVVVEESPWGMTAAVVVAEHQRYGVRSTSAVAAGVELAELVDRVRGALRWDALDIVLLGAQDTGADTAEVLSRAGGAPTERAVLMRMGRRRHELAAIGARVAVGGPPPAVVAPAGEEDGWLASADALPEVLVRPAPAGPAVFPVTKVVLAACLVAVVLGGAFVVSGLPRPGSAATPTQVRATAELRAAGLVVRPPPGWVVAQESEADRSRRATLAHPGGQGMIHLQRTDLNVGATFADVARDIGELLDQPQHQGRFRGLAVADPAGGTATLTFTEVQEGGEEVVWSIRVRGTVQLSVGCSPTTTDGACAAVVDSARPEPQ